jgi:phage protein D
MPSDRAPVTATIDGIDVFEGFVAEVSSSGSKDSGRVLGISASSADQGSKAKEPDIRSMDNSSFGDVFKAWGGKAGLEAQAIGDLAKLQRDYWVMQNESFMSWGQRMARELGGTFQIIGKRAVIASRNEGISASGKPLTPIDAVWGDNLISWDMTPIMSRPKYKDAEVSFFDRAKGERVSVKVETGNDDVDAALRTVISAANEGAAKDKAGSSAKESNRQKGGGSVVIVGDPAAQPEAKCTISGARPGVDGTYTIDGVSGVVTKESYTVTLELKLPDGGAGKDTR